MPPAVHLSRCTDYLLIQPSECCFTALPRRSLLRVDKPAFQRILTCDSPCCRLPLSPRNRRRRSLASPRRHRICSRTTSTRTRTARPHVPWAPETLESRLNFATYPSKGLVACRARLAALATAMDALLKPVLGDLHDPESLASATVGASVADVLQQAQKALSITATAHAGLVSHLVALLPTLCDSAHRLLSCGRKLEPARRWECTVPSLQVSTLPLMPCPPMLACCRQP